MKEKGVIIQFVDNKYVVVNSLQKTKICDNLQSCLDVVCDFFEPTLTEEVSTTDDVKP